MKAYHTVPVQLTDCAFRKMLLGSGNVVALGQVGLDLLPHPSAIVNAGFGVGESPLEIRHVAAIGVLLSEVAGVVPVNRIVGAT